MRHWKPLLLVLLVVLSANAVLLGAWLAVFWLQLDGEGREALLLLLRARPAYAVFLPFLLLTGVGLLVGRFFREYHLPLRRLAEEARLIVAANPAHRVAPLGAAEVRRVAEAVNQLAERGAAAEALVAERVREGRAAVELERDRLAALLEELAEGVVVCNAAGEIVLYNERARAVLEASAGPGVVGLGRPLRNALSGDALDAGVAALRAWSAEEGAGDRPVREVELTPAAGAPVGGRIAPVVDPEQGFAGFVLTLGGPRGAESERTPPLPALRPSPGSRPEFYDFDLFRRGAAAQLDDLPLREITLTAFDTETTGLDPSGGDEIIWLGAVRIVNGRLLRRESFDEPVASARRIAPEATAVHGVTAEMIAAAAGPEEVVPRFLRFAEGSVLLGHNAAFDLRLLELLEPRTGARFTNPVLDTLLLSALCAPEQEDHTLEGLAGRLGIPVVARHSALGDALLTAEAFLRLVPLLEERGIRTLGEARAASRETLYARLRY